MTSTSTPSASLAVTVLLYGRPASEAEIRLGLDFVAGTLRAPSAVAGTLRVPSVVAGTLRVPSVLENGVRSEDDGTRSVPTTDDGTRSVPTTWQQYAHALLAANEMLYVD